MAALGSALAGRGYRVLMVDCDAQGTLSAISDAQQGGGSLADVLGQDRAPLAGIIRSVADGLYLAPASINLATTELQLTGRIGGSAGVIRRALATVASDYDVALLDMAPHIGNISVAALAAAEGLIAPTLAELPALAALRVFLEAIEQVREEVNGDLELIGILVTMYQARTSHHRQALEALLAGDYPVLLPPIPRTIAMADATAARQSIISYAPGSAAALAYQQIAEELEEWLNERHQ